MYIHPYKLLAMILLLTYLISSTACSHLAYYTQAIGGQLDIIWRTQPITPLLTDPKTPDSLKEKLTTILQIREFASKVLHLPDNASYRCYADLERQYAVWSVFATPAFSLQPKQWCFPIVGCVSYRGYFTEAAAHTLASELRSQNDDVYVAGIAAYSTLGWFSDPVLNTMLEWSTPRLAGLIFHELSHQLLYVEDDTAFNEAFATTVEYAGIAQWLAIHATLAEKEAYHQARQRQLEFTQLILTTRDHLQQLYRQILPTSAMFAAKEQAFAELKARYALLKERWGGYNGYDLWFTTDLNNAKLLSVITYQDYVAAFQALLMQQNGDLLAFYTEAARLAELPIEQRHVQLRILQNMQETSDG